jgi:AcrR family transcriptional regulator
MREAARKPVRDKDATRARIMAAATRQFALNGYNGARIDAISRAAGSSDRMIYYYYGSKEALFVAVLEQAYAALGAAEQALNLDESRPAEAIRALVAFTWNWYVDHPEFLTLLNTENLHRGAHIARSRKVRDLSSPLLGILGRILDEGVRQQNFRAGLDVKKIYITIAALAYFYQSNRYTLSRFLGEDLMARPARESWLAHITELMLRELAA